MYKGQPKAFRASGVTIINIKSNTTDQNMHQCALRVTSPTSKGTGNPCSKEKDSNSVGGATLTNSVGEKCETLLLLYEPSSAELLKQN